MLNPLCNNDMLIVDESHDVCRGHTTSESLHLTRDRPLHITWSGTEASDIKMQAIESSTPLHLQQQTVSDHTYPPL
jgi:hypothetical protein